MTATHAVSLILRNIGELVTCDPRRGEPPGVVRGAALAAAGERLVYAGPESGLREAVGPAAGAVEVDAGGMAVLPGFVDAHTHAVWLGDRAAEYARRAAGVSYEEIAAAGGGILATVEATAAGDVDELTAAARPRLRRMLGGGTTTVEVKSGYGLALDAEMRELDAAAALGRESGVPDVVTTYLPLHAVPGDGREAVLEEACRAGLAAAAGRARFVDAFCSTENWSPDECERLLGAAAAAGFGLKLHADQREDGGAAALAARLGAVSADHLEHAADAGLRALAAAGTVGVLLPGAALVLGGPPPPGRRLLEAGATVAVATDCNPGTCYAESMALMVSLSVATAGLTPAAALVAATAGGAAALRLRDRGRLVVGMRCDAQVLDTRSWIDVAYHLGGTFARTVVLRGRPVERTHESDRV